MHPISTAAFISVLALASTLAQAMPEGAAEPSPSPVPCTDTYTVLQAEACDTLVAKLGLSQADIMSLNSGISCDGTIPAGKVLCIEAKHGSVGGRRGLGLGEHRPSLTTSRQ
ncbi:hypothetical protein EDB85DRAFT_1032548 [Lactarius pseudohatsudake]|nr:hypothetical protein EDB85DRAFT_1032548 [Lactarius pseudohatsudake]